MTLLLSLACAGTTSIPFDVDSGNENGDSGDDPAEVAAWAGTGADGALNVDGVVDANATGLASRVDVLDIIGDTITVAGSTAGFSSGDEVILIDLHGVTGEDSQIGAYVFAHVFGTTNATIQLTSVPGMAVPIGHAIVLQRVPQYSDVHIEGILTTSGWDGYRGGVIAFRASGIVLIDGRGSISVDGLGFAGGATGGHSGDDGFQGESFAGSGIGGASSDEGYNEVIGGWAPNLGGGGANITGAGGNYGGGATAGDAWIDGATPPEPGESYGSTDLTTMFLGSGGGGVWNGYDEPGPGGNGGGILFVAATEILAGDSQAFSARGADGEAWSTGTYSYGSGGGSGGTIWITAARASFGSNSADARGGWGESDHTRHGGDGGGGRVRLDITTVIEGDLESASEPDAGYTGAP